MTHTASTPRSRWSTDAPSARSIGPAPAGFPPAAPALVGSSGPAADPSAGAPRPARTRARWEWPALGALLAATALLYLWGLSESGWANSFYSAAVQAGSQSWKAFFYGSSDAATRSPWTSRPPRRG